MSLRIGHLGRNAVCMVPQLSLLVRIVFCVYFPWFPPLFGGLVFCFETVYMYFAWFPRAGHVSTIVYYYETHMLLPRVAIQIEKSRTGSFVQFPAWMDFASVVSVGENRERL